jgi:hypothetical protein
VGGQHGGGHAISFAHFHGPVVGPDKLIVLSSGHGGGGHRGGETGGGGQGSGGQGGDRHEGGGHVAGGDLVDYVVLDLIF